MECINPITTFEGTWEEVLLHGQELAGHQLRVTILDTERDQPTGTPFLGECLEGPADALVEKIMAIGQRCAALPVLDARPEDELLGYNEYGLISPVI